MVRRAATRCSRLGTLAGKWVMSGGSTVTRVLSSSVRGFVKFAAFDSEARQHLERAGWVSIRVAGPDGGLMAGGRRPVVALSGPGPRASPGRSGR